jgi:uncharacterized protein (DUF2164 family)
VNDALQKNQFSGELPRWKVISLAPAQLHIAIQQAIQYATPQTTSDRKNMAIKLQQDVEQRLLASIQRYCAENMDEQVGTLKAKLLLDFCLREIGPPVYNQAILDAQQAMQEKIAEIDATCYEPESGYWKK